LVRACDIPVVVGNCVHYETALELMEPVSPAFSWESDQAPACTTRGVLGVGVPQVTATADVARLETSTCGAADASGGDH